MEAWQKLRVDRAKDIFVTHVECAEDSLIFCVQGLSDEYLVEINHVADMWPPRCTCEDNYWRPDLLCKHTLACLKLMGMDEHSLSHYCWCPEQHELHEYLADFVCVGADADSQDDNKQMRDRYLQNAT